ncbi:transporter substrate-binding domain-containing protein [Roseibium sp. SCPC15]|uniref:substrate-binding periplasmic protein n=1 Tax=Roseibium sp. SCP15 TaxID=3141376 RepID=UPI00333AD33C
MIQECFRTFLSLLMMTFLASQVRAETFTFAIGEWPPFISQKAPGFGLHSRKVTEVFRSKGHDVRFEFLPWRRSLELTKRGTLPATFSWSYVKTRTQDYLYPTTPIDTLKDVYFYPKHRFAEEVPPLTFKDIKQRGLTVVGIAGYWYQEPLEKIGVTFQSVATEEQAWTMLLHGRADLYIENDIVGQEHSRAILGDEASGIGMSEPFRAEPLYILFSKNHPASARMLEIWDSHEAEDTESFEGPAIR